MSHHPPDITNTVSELEAKLKTRHSFLKSQLFKERSAGRLTISTRSGDAPALPRLPKLGPADVINQRYRVEHVLGEGGMGTVYKVSDLNHKGRVLALKTLRDAAGDSALHAVLRTEFKNMAQLHHPNIAEVYDFEPVRGTSDCLFTMEHIDGQNVYLHSHERDWKCVLELAVQACRALSYVHNRKLIHFDLTPRNVLVTSDGQVKVLDFGLAGARPSPSGDASDRSLRGTMAYMAPEQFSARSVVDFRVDLYSLGIVLFELLCRRLPFEATTLDDWIRKHHFERVAFSEQEQGAIPEWLRAAVLRLTAKAPSDRFYSANSVIDAFNRGGGLAFELETQETRQSYVLSSRFVGREAEYASAMRFLVDRLTGPMAGGPAIDAEKVQSPACAFLAGGVGGVGKSRLMREIRQQVQLSSIHFLETDCYEGGLSEFAPVAALVGQVASLAAACDAHALTQKFAPELLGIAPDLEVAGGAQSLAQVAPGVPADTGLDPRQPGGEGNQDGQGRLVDKVAEYFVQVSRVEPFVLYVNDLQWATGGAAQFLTTLVRNIWASEQGGERVPIALFGTYRDDEVEGRPLEGMLTRLEASRAAELIPLLPLTEHAVRELVLSMLGADELPQAFFSRITNETAGNPFFIEEVMRVLVENGSVVQEDGEWRIATDIESLPIPGSMSEAFLRRANFRTSSERELLDLLAVCGRPIAPGLLAKVLNKSAEQVQDDLQRLVARDMIVRESDMPLRYRVSHDRMRHILYDAIEPPRRKLLHGTLAPALEAHLRKQKPLATAQAGPAALLPADENASWLAEHWRRAEKWRKAVEYAVRSGKDSKRVGRFAEALEAFEKAHGWLEKCQEDDTSGDILIELLLEKEALYEKALARTKQYEALKALIELFERDSNTLRLIEILVRLGDFHTLGHQYDDARDVLDHALALARGRKDPTSERRVLRSSAFMYWQKSDLDNIRACYDDILEIDRAHKDDDGFVLDAQNFGLALTQFDQCEEALTWYRRALELSQKAGLCRQGAVVQHAMAATYVALGDLESAALSESKCQEELDAVGEVLLSVHSREKLADILWKLNRFDQAIQWNFKTIEICREYHYVDHLLKVLEVVASRLSERQRHEEAARCLLEATRVAVHYEDPHIEARVFSKLAMAYSQLVGKTRESMRAWERVRALARGSGNIKDEASALERMAKAAAAESDVEAAIHHAKESADLFGRAGESARAAGSLNVLGGLLWKTGRFAEAHSAYRDALNLYREVGDDVRVGLMLNCMGVSLKSLERYPEARAVLEEAVGVNRQTDQALLEGHSEATLADLALEIGYGEATERYSRSIALRQKVGDRLGEGWMCLNIARVRIGRKQADSAQEMIQRALEIAQDIGNAALRDASHQLANSIKGGEFKEATKGMAFARKLDALLQISVAAARVLDPDELVNVALDQMVRILGAERAFLFVCAERQAGDPELRKGRDSSGHDILELVGYSRTVVRKVEDERKPLVLSCTEEGEAIGALSVVAHNLRSVIAAPLLHQDQLVGVMYLDTRVAKGIFTAEDVDVLTAAGQLLASAFETAKAAQNELRRQALERDLALTASVQALFVPSENVQGSRDVKVVGHYEAADECSGDWWMCDTKPDGSVRLLLGDVTGHGPAPAMVTSTVASTYKALSKYGFVTAMPELIKVLNGCLFDLCRGRFLLVLSALEISPQRDELEFWSAGAPPVFVQRKGGATEVLSARGTLLGVQDLELGYLACKFEKGDRLFVFTDGVPDMTISASGRTIGMKRLRKMLDDVRADPAELASSRLRGSLERETSGMKRPDDITYIFADRLE